MKRKGRQDIPYKQHTNDFVPIKPQENTGSADPRL